MENTPRLLDSITDVTEADAELVIVSGSHGGLFPAAIASGAGVRAVIFNDAGIGLERAGISGVVALEQVSMAAAAVDCMSARVGDAKETYEKGRISFANTFAQDLGVANGMTASEAAGLLESAEAPTFRLLQQPEARQIRHLTEGGEAIHLLDSASMVGPEHIGQIVITGSHGALIGGSPERALKAPARIAIFNDAGMGPQECGASRLPALDPQNIAAVTVSTNSARIGDAASTLETGVISMANDAAKVLGATPGLSLRGWLTDQVGMTR